MDNFESGTLPVDNLWISFHVETALLRINGLPILVVTPLIPTTYGVIHKLSTGYPQPSTVVSPLFVRTYDVR